MKIISITVVCILSIQLGYSQISYNTSTLPDSLIILRMVDEMDDFIYRFPSYKIICKNEEGNKGFSLTTDVPESFQLDNLCVKMVNIGGCVEDNELIILFEDDTKIKIVSWNKFNCEGNAWYKLERNHTNSLATKKLKKIRITNGRTMDSFTAEVDEFYSDYFIKLYAMMQKKQSFYFKD